MINYVFFASEEDYLRVAYEDILYKDNVHYQMDFLLKPSKVRNLLFKIHYSSKINKHIKLPFKGIWYKQHFSGSFKNKGKIIFVFFFKWHRIFDGGYLNYLRKRYTGCKCVLFLQDLNNAKKLIIDKEKTRFDHIMVFDKNFAAQNEIEYYPLVYSEGLKNINYVQKPIDLLFVGGAKGRYPLLKQIYDRLVKEGIKCSFYLSGMDPDEKCKNTGIHFAKRVPYDDNIKLLKQSKCVLDIVPSGTNCNTLRASEAIVYGVRIVTNNQHIVEEEFYNPKYISIYTNSDDIDIGFLRVNCDDVDYGYREKISPKALLSHLEHVLFLDLAKEEE